MELDANRPAHGVLCALHVGVEVAPVTSEPLALVDQTRILGRDRAFETPNLGVEHQVLEGPMRRVQNDGRRRLIDLPRLDPHEAVLDHVDPAHPVEAPETVQFVDQGETPTLPSPRG